MTVSEVVKKIEEKKGFYFRVIVNHEELEVVSYSDMKQLMRMLAKKETSLFSR